MRDYDYFAHSLSEETKEVASQFGAHAFELRMLRKEKAPAKVVQWMHRLDPRRLLKAVRRRGLWCSLSLLMAAATCYGTLTLAGLMSAFGATLAINEVLWAGGIIAFAAMATTVIALGVRKHKSIKPVLIALVGTGVRPTRTSHERRITTSEPILIIQVRPTVARDAGLRHPFMQAEPPKRD